MRNIFEGCLSLLDLLEFKKENYVIQYETYSPEGAGEIRAITVEGIILEVSCDGN